MNENLPSVPITHVSLLRLAAWLAEQPSFGDVRMVKESDKLIVGDIRVAVLAALSLATITEMIHQAVGANDRERKLSAILIDALGDRAMLDALERVGGMLRREQIEGVALWKYDHTVREVTPQEDPDLRNVLALVRRDADNSATLQAIAEVECFT